MKFTPNIELDSQLVLAANLGCFPQAARTCGLSLKVAAHRIRWLKNQEQDYIKEVENQANTLSDELWGDYHATAN